MNPEELAKEIVRLHKFSESRRGISSLEEDMVRALKSAYREGQENGAGLRIKCFVCKHEMNRAGALIFGPPIHGADEKEVYKVEKLHLCYGCWMRQIDSLNQASNQLKTRDEAIEGLEVL